MSIRPVDYTSMVPNIQKQSMDKSVENHKISNLIQGNNLEMKEKVQRDQKKVRNVDKSSKSKVSKEQEDSERKSKGKPSPRRGRGLDILI